MGRLPALADLPDRDPAYDYGPSCCRRSQYICRKWTRITSGNFCNSVLRRSILIRVRPSVFERARWYQ